MRNMRTRIIVDSSTDMIPSVREKCIVVPLSLFFGEEEYLDGVTIDYKLFYEKLVESDTLPTTSQASPDAFEKVFREVVEAGDEAVVLTLSSRLSGTCQSAHIAAEEFPGKIHVVDGLNVAIGTGILAQLAVEMAQAGADAKTIAETLTAERENVCVIAMLDTLEYLKKGGRISKTVALAGELLSIKPVVGVVNGEVALLGKARGSKQANNLLVKEIEKTGGVDFSKPLLLGYTGMSDLLLKKYITDSINLWAQLGKEPAYSPIGSVIGTHVGPGAIAAAFFRKTK